MQMGIIRSVPGPGTSTISRYLCRARPEATLNVMLSKCPQALAVLLGLLQRTLPEYQGNSDNRQNRTEDC